MLQVLVIIGRGVAGFMAYRKVMEPVELRLESDYFFARGIMTP